MPLVDRSQLKPGDVVSQDVLTPLGSVLFHKGRVITLRELDILTAFLVPQVNVERAEEPQQSTAEAAASVSVAPAAKSVLHTEYEEMVVQLRRAYALVAGGDALPLLALRTQLERLLSRSAEYRVLSFRPRLASREDFYFHSSVMSALTCYQLAQWTDLPQKDWMQVALAGLLHDIGNVKLDRDILTKPGVLTPGEQEEMKRHTLNGYQLLKPVAALNEGVKLSALQHHERVDGSGYPLGLGSDNIHRYAKLVAIADIFHAMTLERAYRPALSPYVVLEQLEKDAFGSLDPGFVRRFIEKATQFQNGSLVRLSDGRIGEIVFTDRTAPIRPWVSVSGTIVNLTVDRQLYIDECISH
ncbi:HD-GYP domain-containing protein [Paenibacillus albicereus]|uniref:HD-GYP domain-containing protein n=1 Tax=Paenibacillus albicereus TaxID=2726185 RepID=A0A6H2GRV8_9BACL|nr:HD-GYP domain-containing protein [Paenibacillus albicereus]QJC50161.1 HD-GYP domain-containing protein [Paenibacillus albicereus]